MSGFRFEPLTEADRPLLLEWLSRPHVSEWWEGPYTADRVRAEFPDPDAKVAQYLAHEGGRPVGFIQSYVVAGAGGGWWEGERIRARAASTRSSRNRPTSGRVSGRA